ncbi:expressed unknown protein [Seminavis robusta]|uniref:DUF6824 domain-containing protein n=1 Tax=Seminavis robusta TaxID=568900 RepID=A0A9N8DSM0_9STRA|nr:expressed unknown protein [Seminavis robusta]|eukprot:Sro258_g101200.1 n/a (742) ;mRNA; f:80303-82964
MAEEEDGVRYPGQHDFLLGRGGETNNHSGNILFRQLIKDYKEAYQNAPKTQKPLISQKLVAKWRSMDPPGRFLERSDPDKTWMDVGDAVACRKTSKALGERGKRTKTGNAPQDTHPDTGPAPASASAPHGGGVTRAGSKRKPETQHPSAPPASQLKRAPASVPAVINVTMPAPPQSNPAIAAAANASSAAAAANNTAANAHSATQDLSAVLQGLGVPNAAALAAQPNTCTGTATGTPSNAADALHALLKQQQQQNRTQQPIQVANIAALLGQSSNANAATLQNTAAAANVNAQSSDLNALLEQHKKNNDIALLLRNASNPPPATNTNPGIADVAALLQQQQEQRRIENISALLGQTTPAQAANSGTANLAALLGGQQQQQPQPQASLAALMEQQKQQQAQQTCGMAGIAALLQQQQPQSDVAALLQQQQQQQQPQSNSIAAILQQQPQNNNIAAILQQQQQPQNDLSALLQQRRSNEQQQSQNIVLSTLEQLQPHQRTPQVLALLLEQQQIQNSLSSILEQQAPPQQQSNLATLLGQRQQQQASQQNQDAVHSALVAALGLQQPQQQQQPSDLAAMLAQRNPPAAATAAIDVGSLLSAATGVATGTQQTATANPAPSERSAALAEVLSVLSRTDPENKTFGQASSTTAPLANLDASQLQSLMARAQAPTGNAVAAASLQQGTMDPARLQSLLGGAQVSSQIASAAPAASLSDQGHLANMLAAAATATANTSEDNGTSGERK